MANIEDFLERSGFDSVTKTLTDTIYGFRHSEGLPVIESNSDHKGFTFFTRPLLNLTDRNIANINIFNKYITRNPNSTLGIARATLDPRLYYGLKNEFYNQAPFNCRIVDPRLAYIPIMSSSLMTLTGWPSIFTPRYTSEPGLRKEQWTMIDGSYETNEVFDLQATFKNYKSEPLFEIFSLWIRYPSLVFEYSISQYLDVILDFAKDYETRIYRFISDDSGRFIKKAAMTGASMLTTEDTGKTFDYKHDRLFNRDLDDISTTFASQIAVYNDDRIYLDFNRTTATFNPDVRNYLQGKREAMDVIPKELLHMFDNRGYPIIDLDTYEIKWLINKSSKSYKKILGILIDNNETRHYVKMPTKSNEAIIKKIIV